MNRPSLGSVLYLLTGSLVGFALAYGTAGPKYRAASDAHRPVNLPRSSQTESIPELPSSPTTSVNGFVDEGVHVYSDQFLNQEFFASDLRDVTFVESVANTSTGQWDATAYFANTTFDIATIAPAGKDRLYIIGADTSGNVVVERWRLKLPKLKQIGAPPLPKTIVRTELYRAPIFLPIVDMNIDPDDRFMLILAGQESDRRLYSLATQSGASPELLFDMTSLPELSTMTHLTRLQHATLGRVWTIDNLDPSKGQDDVIVLIDSDNDGVFELPPMFGNGLALYQQGGLLNSSQWVDVF